MSNTISSDLSANLQQLSELAHNKTLSAEEKKSALEKASAKTLAEINAEIPSLNFTSSKFAEKIVRLLTDGKYNLLPMPAKMNADLQALRQVADALATISASSMSIDITSILRLLAESHRTLAITNSDSRIQNRKVKIEAADNEFKAREKANKEQRTADLLTACADIVSGAVQLGGSIVSAVGAVKNIKASKDVLDKSKQLGPLTQAREAGKQDLKVATNDFQVAKSGVADIEMQVKSAPRGPKKEALKIQLKEARDTLDQAKLKFEDAKTNYSSAKNIETQRLQEIDTDNLAIKASTQKYEAAQQITNSSATITRGIGLAIAAQFNFRANTERLKADMQGLEKDMASQSEQSAQEGDHNMMEGARNTLQSLSAIEQGTSSSTTNIVRA